MLKVLLLAKLVRLRTQISGFAKHGNIYKKAGKSKCCFYKSKTDFNINFWCHYKLCPAFVFKFFFRPTDCYFLLKQLVEKCGLIIATFQQSIALKDF